MERDPLEIPDVISEKGIGNLTRKFILHHGIPSEETSSDEAIRSLRKLIKKSSSYKRPLRKSRSGRGY